MARENSLFRGVVRAVDQPERADFAALGPFARGRGRAPASAQAPNGTDRVLMKAQGAWNGSVAKLGFSSKIEKLGP